MSTRRPSARKSRRLSKRQKKATLAGRVTSFIRQWDGHLTRDLVQSPGGFGLGKLPEKMIPDATTSMICGYCSTGRSTLAGRITATGSSSGRRRSRCRGRQHFCYWLCRASKTGVWTRLAATSAPTPGLALTLNT